MKSCRHGHREGVNSFFLSALNNNSGNSMATSVRGGIKLEETVGTDSQINTITVVTSGRVGQTHVIQPVQQTSVKRKSINTKLNSSLQHANPLLCGTSPVHDDRSNKSTDDDELDDEHHLDHKDRNSSTVTVDNGHYIVAESGIISQPTCHAQNKANGTNIIKQNVDNDHNIIVTAQTYSLKSVISSDVSYHTVNATKLSVTNMDKPNGVESYGGMQNSGVVQANKISPATVDWLMDNYEKAEGVSLLRSTIYDNYLTHCTETKFDPLNAPSFGKLIRSVFTGLQTRRLGTRGNSKYHYYGIRIKPNSLLNDFKEEESLPVGRTSQSISSKKIKSIKTVAQNYSQCTTNSSDSGNYSQNSIPYHQGQDQEYLGDGANAVPLFPDIILDEIQLDDNCTIEDVDTFKHLYREHYKAFLSAVLNLEFGTIESLWRQFWCSQDDKNDKYEGEQYLSKEKLYSLSKCKTLQLFVKTVDFLFYQNLVKVLIPDVLRPVPRTLTEAIRNFSKSLELWLISAMHGFPEEMISIKVAAVRAFAQTLRRCTSARAVFQNYTQINQILTDLNCMDFHNEQEQVQQINNLGNDNDAVHTKKRVNSKINEDSETLSDCNEPPKKPKTHNYSAGTSTDPGRFNVF
ncbi:transcription factor RFX3-like isoform X2 [Metopolophium dirhodum]|uniref:transcription factor RFX3-like isoform X2 n=1 Tax=Metopolophium dirhodum TaxID=44670 RepID=UPI00298FE009|nr:transcription factor RFX3-like isoform X2 [Metopolophium dirhodum]